MVQQELDFDVFAFKVSLDCFRIDIVGYVVSKYVGLNPLFVRYSIFLSESPNNSLCFCIFDRCCDDAIR